MKSAQAYQKLNQADKALKELTAGYEKLPESAVILANLVKFHTDGKDFQSAVRLCETRLEKNPEEAFTLNLLGSVYLAQKEFDRAVTYFKKAIEVNPEWGMPYNNLAKVYLVQNKKDSAVTELKAALAQDKANTFAWQLLGQIYESDKDYANAAQLYKEAFTAVPTLWAAANNYAFIQSEFFNDTADLTEALTHARNALKLKPGEPIILDTLGWVYYRMGNLAQAHEELKKALDKTPDNPVVNYHLGMVLEAQGKQQEARVLLEKALAGNEDFPGADVARKVLNP